MVQVLLLQQGLDLSQIPAYRTLHSEKKDCNTYLCTSTKILALLRTVDCSSLLTTTQILVSRASRVMISKTFMRKRQGTQFHQYKL